MSGAKPTREFPRLCRGGSKSLTYPAVELPRSIDENSKPRTAKDAIGESQRWMTMKA